MNTGQISLFALEDRVQLQKQDQELQQKLNELEELSNTTDIKKVFNSDENVKQVASTIKLSDITMPRIPTFSTRELTDPKSELVPVNEPFCSNLRIVQEYETNLTYIHHLLECPDGSLWMKDPNRDELLCVKIENRSLRTVSKLNIAIHSAAQQQNGDILISDGSSLLKTIKKVSEKVTSTKYDFSPYVTGGIHILNDSKIVVGVKERVDTFPVKGKRMIYITNQNGMKEKIFEKDEKNERLFSFVYGIASNSLNIIAVIDHIPGNIDLQGRVILLGLDGKVKSIFTGHRFINGKSPFKPTSIVGTTSENFVITDYWNHKILNSEGDLITFINTLTMAFNIGSPVSMVIRKTGNIFCGSADTKNAKLYEIANFPW